MSKRLDWSSVATFTTDAYYDIVAGYYDDEIECDFTKEKLSEARNIINSLVKYLEENDLVV